MYTVSNFPSFEILTVIDVLDAEGVSDFRATRICHYWFMFWLKVFLSNIS